MNIVFEKGLPGFENLKKFTLMNLQENEEFKILQSSEQEISFVTTNPFEVYNNYEINLNEEIIKNLEIENPNDVLVLGIVTLGKNLYESTINLRAPIIININNNLAKQYIMQNEVYETRHPLIRREEDAGNY